MQQVILGAVISAAIILIVLYFFGQQFLLKLLNISETKRKDSKKEIEGGVKELLDSHQKLFDHTVANLQAQLKENRRDVGDVKTQNAAIRTQLENSAKMTAELQGSTEGLKNLLANNRLRGEWGEQAAEDLLLASGFVKGVNYTKQTTTKEGRPDFTILMPDGGKLNVDAKFPFDDLIAYQESKTTGEKKQALSRFAASVKNKVKEITTKDYINPEEQTVDFVVMFIPNEMIFSFIYEKLPEINQYCNERKVILAGPFGFTAVLRLVLQAHKNFKYEKGLQNILGLITKFQEEYTRFGDTLGKLGSQIETVAKTYHEVEGTRSRQLTRLVDRISEHSHKEIAPKIKED